MKKVLVTRLGAWGDGVMITPLLRLLKQDGYHVTVNGSDRTLEVIQNNPNVDEVLLHVTDSIPMDRLKDYWAKLSKKFDRFINLTGSIEEGLLLSPYDPLYAKQGGGMERHLRCNVNYYDRTLKLGGYDVTGLNGELYFNQEEENWGKKIRDQHKNRFVILWSLAGSSHHKVYPYAEIAANAFLKKHRDAVIFTVGDSLCQMLEFLDMDKLKKYFNDETITREFLLKHCKHDQVKHRSAIWNIRKSFIMTKYADAVVGTETGVINAAGCFDTPKVVMLSHSSHENLTKHFKNCYPMFVSGLECPCYPCHRMIYDSKICIKNEILDHAACMAHIPPEKVVGALDEIYDKWRKK